MRWLQKEDDDEDKSRTATGREFQAAVFDTVTMTSQPRNLTQRPDPTQQLNALKHKYPDDLV